MPYPVAACRGNKQSRSAGGPNNLLTKLVGFWPLNEELGGDAVDLHVNNLTLSEYRMGMLPVTVETGMVYPISRGYNNTIQARHVRSDSNIVSTGDVDFTVAAWVYLTGNAGGYIISKYRTTSGYKEFYLRYENFSRKFEFAISSGSLVSVVRSAVVNLGTWYLVIGWHDSAQSQIGIQVNEEAATIAGDTVNPKDTISGLAIGGIDINAIGSFFEGRIGPAMFWKSAAGLGGLLTSAQRKALFNGGNGLTYDQFTGISEVIPYIPPM